jgi:hypothetical protein
MLFFHPSVKLWEPTSVELSNSGFLLQAYWGNWDAQRTFHKSSSWLYSFVCILKDQTGWLCEWVRKWKDTSLVDWPRRNMETRETAQDRKGKEVGLTTKIELMTKIDSLWIYVQWSWNKIIGGEHKTMKQNDTKNHFIWLPLGTIEGWFEVTWQK